MAVIAPDPIWRRAEFDAARQKVAAQLVPTTLDIIKRVQKVLVAAHEAQLALPQRPTPAQAEAVDDIRAQLKVLLPKGFVARTGAARLGT